MKREEFALALNAQGPEITVTCSGVPYGLVQKRTEPEYFLADGAVLLENERDSLKQCQREVEASQPADTPGEPHNGQER